MSFTVVQSVRTAAGPRQKVVASWSTLVREDSYFYHPAMSDALSHAEKFTTIYQRKADYWREALKVSNHPGVVFIPTIGRTMHISRDVASRNLAKLERQAAKHQAQADGLRAAISELGNWTWDRSEVSTVDSEPCT